MLCHITRPDSVVLEVEVDPKANGEDILNKVSVGNSRFKFRFLKLSKHFLIITCSLASYRIANVMYHLECMNTNV